MLATAVTTSPGSTCLANDALKLTTDDVAKTIEEAKAAVELGKANLTLAKRARAKVTTGDRRPDSTMRFARYVDEFKTPTVGAYFDVGNVVEYGYPQEWIRELGKRILKVHIKEYAREKRFKYRLGEGEIDWVAVRAALNGCWVLALCLR